MWKFIVLSLSLTCIYVYLPLVQVFHSSALCFFVERWTLNTESTAVISGNRCKTNKPEGIIYVRHVYLLPLYSVRIKDIAQL